MEINEKLRIIEESCKRLAQKDVAELNKNIEDEIEKRIKGELKEYQEKEEFSYNKKLEKMEKDYNKQIYSIEMDAKKEILEQKNSIQKEIKKDILQLMKNFTTSNEYESFLFKKIDEVIKRVPNTYNSIIGIVEKDRQNFSNKIMQQYNIDLKTIDDKYIGGCILEDSVQGIYIDNTISNSIDENL